MKKMSVSLEKSEKSITAKEIKEFLENFARKQLINNSELLSPLADMFYKIEKTNSRVSDLIMNVVTFVKFRKLKEVEMGSEYKFLTNGLMANIWGANIWIDSCCKKNEVEVYAEDDYQELFENHPQLKKSFETLFGKEYLANCQKNKKAVKKAKKV